MNFILTSPTTPSSCDYLLNWIRSPEENFLWATTSFSFPLDQQTLNSHVEASLSSKPVRKIFTALFENDAVGHIELERLNEANGSATICRVLVNPASRGQGIGTAMMNKLVHHCFENLHLRRLELFVFSSNEAAIKTYSRSGFVTEGHLRKWMRHEDRFLDADIMAILKEDWKPA